MVILETDNFNKKAEDFKIFQLQGTIIRFAISGDGLNFLCDSRVMDINRD